MELGRRHGISDTKFALSIAIMGFLVIGIGVAFSQEIANNSAASGQSVGGTQAKPSPIGLDLGMLVQDIKPQLVRPPVSVRHATFLIQISNPT